MSDARDDTTHGHPADGRDETAVVGVSAAAGRDQYVGAQISATERAARTQATIHYDADLYRAVQARWAGTYANHIESNPGRYNLPGQSTVYTAPTMADLQAEVANYEGLDGKAVVRSHFEGELLDARTLPGVGQGALTQGYGADGRMKSLLATVTGEDPYTLPRAVGDVARQRGLDGVAAPANHGNTNVALFPDDPSAPVSGPGRLATGLRGLDHVVYAADGSGPGPVSTLPYSTVPDAAPNKNSPLGIRRGSVTPANPAGKPQGLSGYAAAVEADAVPHGRAGGARYGAAGAAIVSLAEGAATGHVDGRAVAANVAVGAAAGQAEGAIARGLTHVLPPPNVAGAVGGALPEAAARLRPSGFAAGVGASGIVGGVVGGAVATWHDADEVKSGRMTAGAATANVVTQTGVGVGAGLAGAAAGAAVGSVVPVAGTAIGAVVGFGVGAGAGYLAEHSAALHAGERALGDALTRHAEPALQHAWHGIATGVDAVKSAEASAEQAVRTGLHRTEVAAAAAGHAVGDVVTNRVEPAARDLWRATAARADTARAAVEHAATEGVHRAEADAVAAGHAVGDAAASAWGSLTALGQRLRGDTEQHGAALRVGERAPPARTLTPGR